MSNQPIALVAYVVEKFLREKGVQLNIDDAEIKLLSGNFGTRYGIELVFSGSFPVSLRIYFNKNSRTSFIPFRRMDVGSDTQVYMTSGILSEQEIQVPQRLSSRKEEVVATATITRPFSSSRDAM